MDPLLAHLTIATAAEALVDAAGPALIATSFLLFNAMRIVLHVPQLLTCLRDPHGCSAINLWTWCSWVAASLSNALYMGVLLHDRWGLALNLCNAGLCAATVAITCVKRRRARRDSLSCARPAASAWSRCS